MPYLIQLLILLSKGHMHDILDHHYNLEVHTVYVNSLYMFGKRKYLLTPLGSALNKKKSIKPLVTVPIL